jgi:hypothetical protein
MSVTNTEKKCKNNTVESQTNDVFKDFSYYATINYIFCDTKEDINKEMCKHKVILTHNIQITGIMHEGNDHVVWILITRM